MDRPSLYDDDIVTWAEEQAVALGALAARPDLSNTVDRENVAEEIESVGPSRVQAVESLLAQVLCHLLKQLSVPIARANLHWRQETLAFHAAARTRCVGSMRRRIHWDQVWKLSQVMAESGLLPYGDMLIPRLPTECPITPDELLAESLDIDSALKRIVGAAGSH